MSFENFEAFSEWFKTNRYFLVAKPVFETESSQIMLICIHCKQGPFTVYPVKKGGWNIGHFTRHHNTENMCPNQIPEALMSMDSSNNVSLTLEFFTLFTSY